MAKAFWVIRPAIEDEDGGWKPDFPIGFQSYYQVIGDLRIFGPDPGFGNHKHAQIGPLALGANHYHWMFWQQGGVGWYQEYIGPGAQAHTHIIPFGPTHFLVAAATTNIQYNEFILAEPNALIIAEMPVSGLGGGIFNVDAIEGTNWDAGTRSSWEARSVNFGLVLPSIVTNPRRFIRWLISCFEQTHQNIKDDANYRMKSFTSQE